MNCGYGEKLILYFYGEAGAETASGVEAHLKTCAVCRDAFAALAAVEGLLKESAALPPASALEAVMRQARAAAAGARRPFFAWNRVETVFAGVMAVALMAVFALSPRGTSSELAWNSGLDSSLDSVEYSLYQAQSELTASSGDWEYSYDLLNAERQTLDSGEG